VAAAEHRRNLVLCQDGVESCDYSALTASEASQLALVERQRNYTPCVKNTVTAIAPCSRRRRRARSPPNPSQVLRSMNDLSYASRRGSCTISGREKERSKRLVFRSIGTKGLILA
jgi:hypothetical protein